MASDAANFQMKKKPKSKEGVDKRMIVQEIMGIRTRLDGFLDMLNSDSNQTGPCNQAFNTKEAKEQMKRANQQEQNKEHVKQYLMAATYKKMWKDERQKNIHDDKSGEIVESVFG